MKTKDVIAYYRSIGYRSRNAAAVAIAKALGISRAAVYQWGEYVPERSALRLQMMTGGVLYADPALYRRIGRHTLRGPKFDPRKTRKRNA